MLLYRLTAEMLLSRLAFDAVAALPLTEIPQVPDAFVPVVLGAPIVL